jgi:integrase
MGAAEVEAFLTHIAVKENVAASTQNQALSALLLLRTVQELLGHKDVKTTMIYTHACTERSERVLNRVGLAVRSPLD